nr:S-layer homology domain-containing protein [Butyricicoccus faecihominis]
MFFAAGNDGDKKASRIIGARYVWGVAYCAANGIMQGDADGAFRPGDTVTRAELATVIARLEARKEHT